ncbi:MAG TPA: serine protease [Pseudonocardiaceae bacterium]
MLTEPLINPDLRNLAAVQAEHEATLLAMPNVVGVGIGRKRTAGKDVGKPCLTVLVDIKLDKDLLALNEILPDTIGSVATDVREVGVLQAGAGPALAPPRPIERADGVAWEREWPVFDEPSAPQRDQLATLSALSRAVRGQPGAPGTAGQPLAAARIRPAIGGSSVGHYRGTAGTIGICCVDAASAENRYYLLSNNHVLANGNDATVGDPILQPAPADGGNPVTDTIGRLARFVPLRFGDGTAQPPLNYVDAAIAGGRFDQLDRRIQWTGEVRGTNPTPALGCPVQKSGRASYYTTGAVTVLNATIDVSYPGGRLARFAKQIVCTGLSTGGDSGALVTDFEQRAAGLLFAASPLVSVLNPIPLVEGLLGIRVARA